jgi:hypothetical protein
MLTMSNLGNAFEEMDAERIDLERLLAKLKALPLHHASLKIVPSNHEVVPPELKTVQAPTAWIDSNVLVWPFREWDFMKIRWDSAVKKLNLTGANLTHYALDGRRVNAASSGIIKASAIDAVSAVLSRIEAMRPRTSAPAPKPPVSPVVLPSPVAAGRPWWHYALGGMAGLGALFAVSKVLKSNKASSPA